MPWLKGFDFRLTAGFVTDPADCTYVLETDSYPTTRNGVTFGWEVSPAGGRDRDSGSDPRLAGINQGNGIGTFRVDLPAAGKHDISLAMGDLSNTQEGTQVIVRDNTTPVLTIGPHDTAVAEFYDATDTPYTAAAWPANNDAVRVTFGSSVLRLTLETATSNSVIAHLFIAQVGPRFILGTH